LDVVTHDPGLKGVDGQAGVIGPFAVLDAESPCMPRAGDDPLFIEITAAEGGAHVWAEVIDGEVAPVPMENGHKAVPYLERAAFAFGNVADLGDWYKVVVW